MLEVVVAPPKMDNFEVVEPVDRLSGRELRREKFDDTLTVNAGGPPNICGVEVVLGKAGEVVVVFPKSGVFVAPPNSDAEVVMVNVDVVVGVEPNNVEVLEVVVVVVPRGAASEE